MKTLILSVTFGLAMLTLAAAATAAIKARRAKAEERFQLYWWTAVWVYATALLAVVHLIVAN